MGYKYAGIYENDIVDSDDGLTVSFWTQGCPFKCKGCHNPETWDEKGGLELPKDYVEKVCKLIFKNKILRNLSILGGEPLYKNNLKIVYKLLTKVKERFPKIKIYLWTGYTIEELFDKQSRKRTRSKLLAGIIKNVDILIEGRFEESLRDTTLSLRGSSNQRIFKREGTSFRKLTNI